MVGSGNATAVDYASMDDAALVQWAQRGRHGAFRQIMQRCNQRLFRIARSVVNDDDEAEDVVQAAYVHAFEKLRSFRGESTLLTWMTRIAFNEAFGRRRQRRDVVDVGQVESAQIDGSQVVPFPSRFGSEDPAARASREQIRQLVERAIDALPQPFRIVFVMREMEGCSVEETASSLDIRPETVKTRLHRARRLLRIALQDTLAATLSEAFPFLGQRCSRMTERVLEKLEQDVAAQAPGDDAWFRPGQDRSPQNP